MEKQTDKNRAVAKKKGSASAKRKESGPATILRFSEDHLWVRAEANRGQIGLSDFGQDVIGELIAIELPDIGDPVEKGESFGQLESVRELQELLAPITGTVVAINGELEDNPSLANEDPYHEGWLIEVEFDDESQLDDLMATEEYEDFIAKEGDG